MFQAGDVVETDFEGFLKLLRSKTRAFVTIDDHEYYITHTDGYWRVQDCEALNDKGHFTDCSELVNTVCEVVELPWICGKSLHDSFSGATVYEAVAHMTQSAVKSHNGPADRLQSVGGACR